MENIKNLLKVGLFFVVLEAITVFLSCFTVVIFLKVTGIKIDNMMIFVSCGILWIGYTGLILNFFEGLNKRF